MPTGVLTNIVYERKILNALMSSYREQVNMVYSLVWILSSHSEAYEEVGNNTEG